MPMAWGLTYFDQFILSLIFRGSDVTDAIMVSDGQILGLILHTAAMKISYQIEDENDTECCFLSLSS